MKRFSFYNKDLRKRAEDTDPKAWILISRIKDEYAGKETILNQRLDVADSRKKNADDPIANCKKKIREEAKRSLKSSVKTEERI